MVLWWPVWRCRGSGSGGGEGGEDVESELLVEMMVEVVVDPGGGGGDSGGGGGDAGHKHLIPNWSLLAIVQNGPFLTAHVGFQRSPELCRCKGRPATE